jgi:hypothetical protein
MRLAVVLLAVVLLAGCCHPGAAGVQAEHAGRAHCGPVTLAPGGGWRTRSATAGGLRIAEATTATFREPEGVFPDRTLAALPPNGILVAAWDYGREPQRNLAPARRLPYRLAGFRHDRGWEGQPAANVPQYVLFTSLRHHGLDVRVFFGRQDPSGQLRARAQAELATLRWRLCTPPGVRPRTPTVTVP